MVGVAAAVAVGAGVTKGVSGYKAGQASAKSAMATAQYNKAINDANVQMEKDRGRITRSITERNAEVIADRASYDGFLIDRQATSVEAQTEFDVQIATRQYDIFTAEKRAKWGNSGVTMQGSPATVAFADAHAASVNLANIELRGLSDAVAGGFSAYTAANPGGGATDIMAPSNDWQFGSSGGGSGTGWGMPGNGSTGSFSYSG